jgi:hypothetical protein
MQMPVCFRGVARFVFAQLGLYEKDFLHIAFRYQLLRQDCKGRPPSTGRVWVGPALTTAEALVFPLRV